MEGSWLMEGNFTPTMSPTEEPECDASGLEDADNKCDFVKSYCGDVVTLIDYMQIFYCTSGGHGMRAILTFVLVVWLVLLISLLATTADYYFVPPLEYLSFSMLKLSPEVAGITLLALGNGAPDVFGALAGINGQDVSKIPGAHSLSQANARAQYLYCCNPWLSHIARTFKWYSVRY
jgi:hypothetical protein